MTTDRTLPPPQGPEYARCFGCGHIEPEHRPGTGPCLLCACVAYRSVPAIPEPSAAGLGVSATPSRTDQAAAALAEDLRYLLNYRGPGHDHERPGVWDTSGMPCGHCARLEVARRNLAAYDAGRPAVLPPADRAAVLREAADELGRMDYESDSTDYGYDTYRDAWNGGVMDGADKLRRLADEAQQPAPSVHGESVAHLAGLHDNEPTIEVQAAVDGWRGATELVPDHEVRRLAATGVVGYQQDQGRLLHCLHHRPVPASRWADFHEVTSDDLPDGGICVHPRCGADLLAVQPAVDARQDGAPS